jgi:four helix bundle protein
LLGDAAMRDYRKLLAFQKADALVLAIYRWSEVFPSDERFGLRSQIRRSTVSVSANIVEGSARSGEGEYVNH